VEPEELADCLDRLYCYHLMMAQWTIAVGSRHSVSSQLLLAGLQQEAQVHLEAAIQLAGRIVELGGALTADPSDVAYRAPIDSIKLPDNPADARRALEQLYHLTASAIDAYQALLNTVGEADPVSRQIVETLLSAAANRSRAVVAAMGSG
jgi:ferritin-like protein